MCKLIAELTGSDKTAVRHILHELEQSSALPGIDVRFAGDVYATAHYKMRELGLDPHDTTPQELYRALYNLVTLHDHFLTQRLQIDTSEYDRSVLTAIQRFMNDATIHKHVFALKPAAIRTLLQHVPPKQLMKLLHYRSLSSMLKRESPEVLLTVSRYLESAQWQERLLRLYAKLEAHDFETRPVDITVLTGKKWQKAVDQLTQPRNDRILSSSEAACILLLPTNMAYRPGLTLANLTSVLHHLHELRVLSSYIKFHHMRPKFGQRFSNQLRGKQPHHIKLGTQPVHWRVVHRHFGASQQAHPELFEPHIQPQDIAYHTNEEILYRIEPALHFWHGLQYVGLPTTSGPVSFSLVDMAINLVNKLTYDRRYSAGLRDGVWHELFQRYAANDVLERQILSQLTEEPVRIHKQFVVARQLDVVIPSLDQYKELFIITKPTGGVTRRSSKAKVPTARMLEMDFAW